MKSGRKNACAFFTRNVQSKLKSMPMTTENSRIICSDAKANSQTHVRPSFFSSWRLYLLPTREGGLNIKEPKDWDTGCVASLNACAPLEDKDRANAHHTQERITHYQRTARLNKINRVTRILQKVLRPIDINEIALEKRTSNWFTALPPKRCGFTLTKSKFRDKICIR